LRDGSLDPDLGAMLLSDLRSIEVDTARAGIALALGLCAHEPAVPDLRGMLDTKYLHEVQSGYVVVALAMLGDHGAAGDIVALMRTAVRRPFVLQQCAVALGHLGDTETVPALLDMLKSSESTATMAAIAQALGELRDRRSIEPLIAALQDPDRSALARAFVAAALGGVGDKDVVRWNAAIARDVNYSALVDTLSNGNTGVLDIL
jgi:HEAT repeat protein